MLGDGMVSFGVAVVADRPQELEGVAEDRCSSSRIRLVDLQRRPTSNSSVAVVVVERAPAMLLVGPADAAELVDEVHVPGRTAELAVGRGPQTDVCLHRAPRRGSPSSSTARSSSSLISPAARSSRASSNAGGRSRLPTWSARNGAVVRCGIVHPFCCRRGLRPVCCLSRHRRNPYRVECCWLRLVRKPFPQDGSLVE